MADDGDGDCAHDMLVRGLCVACGADLSAEKHEDEHPRSAAAGSGRKALGDSGVGHVVKGAQMRNKARFAEDDARRLEQTRKLYLILDLDETLIHTVRGGTPPPHARLAAAAPTGGGAAADAADGAGAVEVPPDGKTVELLVTAAGQAVMLRPYLRAFLQRMSSLFQISLYTMGGQDYARLVIASLDPGNQYFRGGICAWDDGLTRTRKDLSRVACRREMVLVVDDTIEVWGDDWRSVLLIPRWVGEPTDDALLRIGEHLAAVHELAYGGVARSPAGALPDLREVLARARPQIFAGFVFSFSGLFPRGMPLDAHAICQLIRASGGEVEEELSERSTHLVFRRLRTEKIQRAAVLRRAHGSRPSIMWESWLLACLALWRLLPEGHMALPLAEAAKGAAPEQPDDRYPSKRPRDEPAPQPQPQPQPALAADTPAAAADPAPSGGPLRDS